jgi:Uma2 family endonuclease
MTTLRRGAERRPGSRAPQPTWDVATLFPVQGNWSVEEYLALPGNRLLELSDGVLEVLPMPTTLYQWITWFMCNSLNRFTEGWSGLGLALPAPLRVRLREGKFREPNVVFLLSKHKERALEEYWQGADLALEVTSNDPADRRRDLVTKRAEYARARIAEYWIVDVKLKEITVLRLKGKAYEVHGIFKKGQTATSRLLPGFAVAVADVFAGP